MKVLQLNGYESPGRRFSGLSLAPLLKNYGITSTHLIWQRDTTDPAVLGYEAPDARLVNEMYARVEQRLGFQSVFYTNGQELMRRREFEEADLIHLHLIHTGYLSLFDLSAITAAKPTVWTLHDPWAFTGHCIYPFDCQRWRSGCKNCPDLDIPFAVSRDSAGLMFSLKRQMLKRSSFDVIVASSWMASMVEASPLFKGVPVHQVPFGLDLEQFGRRTMPEARKRFGIPNDAIVIGFRAQHGPYKGFEYIDLALDLIRGDQKIWLLTTGNPGLLDRFRDRFGIVELGWVHDEEVMRDFFVALDIFLMPSIVEAFGVMAIEAMASRRPVVVFDGTSLPEVTLAPEIGVLVPARDAKKLALSIQQLIDDPDERHRRGQLGRKLAESRYEQMQQVCSIARIYDEVFKRRP